VRARLGMPGRTPAAATPDAGNGGSRTTVVVRDMLVVRSSHGAPGADWRDRGVDGYVAPHRRGVEQFGQLAGLITRRSQVQILPPLLVEPPDPGVLPFCGRRMAAEDPCGVLIAMAAGTRGQRDRARRRCGRSPLSIGISRRVRLRRLPCPRGGGARGEPGRVAGAAVQPAHRRLRELAVPEAHQNPQLTQQIAVLLGEHRATNPPWPMARPIGPCS
jgi:hypothetical protein